MMRRRTLLKIGTGTALVLGAAAGSLALLQPGMRDGRLTAAGKAVFAAVAAAVLEGAIPAAGPARVAALQSHLQRLDAVVAGLHVAARGELAQLTTLLASAAGRLALTGLHEPWERASTEDVAAALQRLRHSSLELRQQTYHALRDLTNGAYFADPSAWGLLGYPGPVPV
jgi:hypothetical protein